MDQGVVLPVKIQPGLLRPLAYRVLSKKYGLNIKSDGLVTLADYVGRRFGMNWKKDGDTLKFLEELALVWKQQERGLFVDKTGVEEVIGEIKERHKISDAVKTTSPIDGKHHINTLEGFLKDNRRSNVEQALPGEEPLQSATPADVVASDTTDNQALLNNNLEMDAMDVEDNKLHETVDELNWQDYFKVLNAFTQQHFRYDHTNKQYECIATIQNFNQKKTDGIETLLPDVQASVSMFPNRYHILRDRVMRNEMFQESDSFNPLSSTANLEQQLVQSAGDSFQQISLTQIKNLLGRNGKNFLLLGLMKKNSKGNWSLEDPSGDVELEISQAIPNKGTYFVPGCILLVEGIYYSAGHKFHVTSIAHPPGERREATLDAIGNVDFLGIHQLSKTNYVSRLDKNLKIRLHFLEKELTDHKLVVLGGDIFLDQLVTLEALRKVFQRLESDPPIVLVFQGSFSSIPVYPLMSSKNISATTSYKNSFDSLASLLANFPALINYSTLIFVPGVNDPWGSLVNLGTAGTWPQKPVPLRFTQRINRVCKKVVWGSNPTRIAYLSQEIVIVRDDVNGRFKRHNIVFPANEETDEEEGEYSIATQPNLISELDDEYKSINQLVKSQEQLPLRIQESRKIVKTILDQGHLSPFDTSIRPIIWNLDDTLQLSPIPSTLFLSDTTAPEFDVTYNGCKTLNTGKFLHKRKARFLEFIPSLKKASQEEVHF